MKLNIMSKYYKEFPHEYPSELPPLAEGEVRGHAWSAVPSDGKYVLSFISGALHGKEISIEISSEEYSGLRDGSLSVETVQRRYKTG